MKRYSMVLALALALSLALTGCGTTNQEGTSSGGSGSVSQQESGVITVTDWNGHAEQFEECPKNVVALSGSLGEVWLNAGGTLKGTTTDAVSTRKLELPEDTVMVGSIKEPDLETVLSLEPDFIILDNDIKSHKELIPTLEEMKIPYGMFHEEYFEDYLSMLKQFCALTGNSEAYEQKGTAVKAEIDKILADAPKMEGKTVLLLRAYSSGFKAKDSENQAGIMLKEFGLENVLDKYDTMLEDLSMEEIMTADPDYIMVTTMGKDTQAAIDNLEEQLCSDPAWESLTAVKEGHYHVLPKDLFHYKPNARWAEAYQYLSDLLSK